MIFTPRRCSVEEIVNRDLELELFLLREHDRMFQIMINEQEKDWVLYLELKKKFEGI